MEPDRRGAPGVLHLGLWSLKWAAFEAGPVGWRREHGAPAREFINSTLLVTESSGLEAHWPHRLEA